MFPFLLLLENITGNRAEEGKRSTYFPPNLPVATLFMEELSVNTRTEECESGCRRTKAEKNTQLRRQASDGNINSFLLTPTSL